MTFAKRMTRLPRPFGPERAEAISVPGLSGDALSLAQATGSASPFLAGLLEKEGAWLAEALEAPEEATRRAWELDALAPDLPKALRQAKRRVALMTALADLGGVWPLETVTGILTDFADAACDLALKGALAPMIARGKLPGVREEDLEHAAGVAVFAMGKMGAHELNYSSDIDLICLFDETQHDPADYAELRSGLVRAVRKMATTLSDIGAEGYVFRTDLRLRPDAGVTPVVLAMGMAEGYYESVGRTWERAAWIKARPAAGDLAAGARFQATLRPFVWRKHLDFAAIQDAHDMRLAIRDAKGLAGPIALPGHNMKLGQGGIREIEFFTQTRQLISGGRDESLRLRGTVPALEALARGGWVAEGTADELAEHYSFHRTVEHRLQMVQDAQTHSLPRDEEGFERLAAMMDMDRPALEKELRWRLWAVHGTTEGFFSPDQAGPEPAAPGDDTLDPALIARWHGYPAFRSERAQASFARVRSVLATGLKGAARPDEALAAFDGFLSGLPAGVQLFALLEANPHLVDLLIDALTIAPPLADYLARNAQVLDAVIGGDFFTPWPGQAGLESQLEATLSQLEDYESKLDGTRRWMKEWHFRIGVHYLRKLLTASEAGVQYADLARAVVAGLWPHVIAQFARRHGAPPGRGAMILGMGSLGAGRLTPASDLDMIVVYDPLDVAESAGPKPLPARTYYARLTQAMVTALSAQTAEGRLYDVDMRLRPSGNQGPVATSWRAFQAYQRSEAWIWEHLALTRARVVAGPEALCNEVAHFLSEIIKTPRERPDVLAAVSDMRRRIEEARAPDVVWSVKSGPGRMQDIELFVQAAALLSGRDARVMSEAFPLTIAAGLSDPDGVECLRQAHGLAFGVQMAIRMAAKGDVDIKSLGAGAIGLMVRAAEGKGVADAEKRLTEAFEAARSVIEKGLNDG